MLARLKEKPAQIFLIPSMLAFFLQILIVVTYWQLHTPLTALPQL